MTTKSDIEGAGGHCELVSDGFWECTDANGDTWWCDTESCQKPLLVAGSSEEVVRASLDLFVVPEKSGGSHLVVLPHAAAGLSKGESSKKKGKGGEEAAEERQEFVRIEGQHVRLPRSGVLKLGGWSIDFHHPGGVVGFDAYCCNNSLGDCVLRKGGENCADGDRPITVWMFAE